MKNQLPDLQNHLFKMIETLMDDSLRGDDLDRALKISLAVNDLAKTAVANGALMARCADTLYGIPVSDKVPLIPQADADREIYLLDKGRKPLLSVPRDDGCGGFKRHKERPA
jgi:streptogramin lyase